MRWLILRCAAALLGPAASTPATRRPRRQAPARPDRRRRRDAADTVRTDMLGYLAAFDTDDELPAAAGLDAFGLIFPG